MKQSKEEESPERHIGKCVVGWALIVLGMVVIGWLLAGCCPEVEGCGCGMTRTHCCPLPGSPPRWQPSTIPVPIHNP